MAARAGRPSGSCDLATRRRGPQGALRSKPLWAPPPVGAGRSRANRLDQPPDRDLRHATYPPSPHRGRAHALRGPGAPAGGPAALSAGGRPPAARPRADERAARPGGRDPARGLTRADLRGAHRRLPFGGPAHRAEDADKARDDLTALLRDFDGSEILDVEIQAATRAARAADGATLALEIVRDTASASYTLSTGEVWCPWKGNVRGSRVTAAQIEARDALRARRAEKHAAASPGAAVVAFRAAPQANSAEDANRIFDALNWALARWPDMALATSGRQGRGEAGHPLGAAEARDHSARPRELRPGWSRGPVPRQRRNAGAGPGLRPDPRQHPERRAGRRPVARRAGAEPGSEGRRGVAC